MRLKTTKGVRVNIIESIAPVWKKIGFLMDLDPKGQKVEHIEAEHALKQDGLDICCQEMFKLWLEDPNATWGKSETDQIQVSIDMGKTRDLKGLHFYVNMGPLSPILCEYRDPSLNL